MKTRSKHRNTIAWCSTIASLIPWLSHLFAALLSASPALSEPTAEIIDRPKITEDEVILRVKVTDDGERPAMQLQPDDFKVMVDGEPLTDFRWENPEETVPPPAWIVVLIDFSGSMAQNDSGGQRKLDGAIEATWQFLQEISDRGGNVKVAILPFGEGLGDCPGAEVTQAAINQRFFPADDIKQQNLLDYLARQTPCASTNIYSPLEEAIRLFGNKDDPRFYLPKETSGETSGESAENSDQPAPRLSVILLSDGYHNKPNEGRDFEALRTLLKGNQDIIVHTLGYGLTPDELGAKYELGHPATREDIQTKKKPNNPVPDEEFVDEKRLQEIANETRGITEFSADTEAVSEALQLFLNSLLGEYEIGYIQANADRGSKHRVELQVAVNESEAKTDEASYTIAVFGRSLPREVRLIMTIAVLLLLGFGGVWPFWKWSVWLKQEAEQDF
jgi:hypothetical protein